MQGNSGQTIVDILSQCKEPLPKWLDSDSPTFDRKTFFDSRTVYYPGSGCDRHPVELCAPSHAAHTFLYVDWGVKREEIIECLEDRTKGFRGYETLCRQPITEDALRPGTWERHFKKQEVAKPVFFPKPDDSVKPFRLFVVLRRKDGDEDLGPRRLAILFIGGDGFEYFDKLYCQEDGTPPPYLVVVEDYGWGGNYDRFDKGGLLERIARKCSVRPKYLLVGEPSTKWTGYEDTKARPERGGYHGYKRHLFCLCCDCT